MPRQRLDGVRGVLWRIFILQGCFVENLHIIGLESKLFFIGGKPELAQITGGKDILILISFILVCLNLFRNKLY